jgi:hypothetical protein
MELGALTLALRFRLAHTRDIGGQLLWGLLAFTRDRHAFVHDVVRIRMVLEPQCMTQVVKENRATDRIRCGVPLATD